MVLTTTLSTFAYSSGSDISGGSIILSIVMIVFAILNLILFFKLWGMTNDVKRIADMLSIQYGFDEAVNRSHAESAPKPAAPQKKKKAISIDSNKDPLMGFYDDCTKLYRSCKSREEFESQVDDIIQQYLKTTGNDYGYLKGDLWEQLKQL